MEIGTATAAAGERDRGTFKVATLPTGTAESIPIVLINGSADGPTLWVTAGIHGNEVTGIASAFSLAESVQPDDLAGQLVIAPMLNPAGVRRNNRTSYYHDEDPNRTFPDLEGEDPSSPPKVQTLIATRLFDVIAETADAAIDLHTASVGSMPFTIRDRVLVGEAENGEWSRSTDRGEQLAEDLDTLVHSFGLPVVTEYPKAQYLEKKLHRSTAGALLNKASIPAFTVELGGPDVVDPEGRSRAVAGCGRVMHTLGMVETIPSDLDGPRLEAPVDFPVRRARHPPAPLAGIAIPTVQAGDVFESGETVVTIHGPSGHERETVETEHDGYVIGSSHGVGVYENDPVLSLAVHDDGDLVVDLE